ncbi:MAG: hypothetical protein WC234_00750 [Endomicrobiaceae bacterium]
MLALFTDVILIALLLLFIYIGFSTGIIKSFFAVSAGFFSVLLAENYPYQIGINYYLIFIASAIAIFLLGMLIFQIVKFLYLSIFDKTVGAFFAVIIWFVLSANVMIPVLNCQSSEPVKTKVSSEISELSSRFFPSFSKFTPNLQVDEKIKESKDYILMIKE